MKQPRRIKLLGRANRCASYAIKGHLVLISITSEPEGDYLRSFVPVPLREAERAAARGMSGYAPMDGIECGPGPMVFGHAKEFIEFLHDHVQVNPFLKTPKVVRTATTIDPSQATVNNVDVPGPPIVHN